jgi:hypothetical protein
VGVVEKLIRPLKVDPERCADQADLLSCLMRRDTEQLFCPFNEDIAVTKMAMDRTLDDRAICNVNEIRKLPRAMRRICFTPIYPTETFAYGALSSTYF